MSSEKRIAANRRNALQSTGPKTERGKLHASYNAVTYGFYSMRILPGEDPMLVAGLWKEICDQYDPVGPFEIIELQLALADLVRLARLDRVEFRRWRQLIDRVANERLELDEIDSPGRADADALAEPTSRDLDEALERSMTERDSLSFESELDRRRDRTIRSINRHLASFFALKDRRLKAGDLAFGGVIRPDDALAAETLSPARISKPKIE